MENTIKQLKDLETKVSSAKSLTIDEATELELELTTLQFEKFSDVFEELRSKLGEIDITTPEDEDLEPPQ